MDLLIVLPLRRHYQRPDQIWWLHAEILDIDLASAIDTWRNHVARKSPSGICCVLFWIVGIKFIQAPRSAVTPVCAILSSSSCLSVETWLLQMTGGIDRRYVLIQFLKLWWMLQGVAWLWNWSPDSAEDIQHGPLLIVYPNMVVRAPCILLEPWVLLDWSCDWSLS